MTAIISIGSGILIAAVLIVTLLLGGSSFHSDKNVPETIYGPPEMFEVYDPSQNIEEDVYGPPEMWNGQEGGEEIVWDSDPVIQEDMDLPPDAEDHEHDHTEESEIPESFDPEENITPDIYGPPESFN